MKHFTSNVHKLEYLLRQIKELREQKLREQSVKPVIILRRRPKPVVAKGR